MLHTLNKAWIKCFLKQAKDNKNFLFVAKDVNELKTVYDIISDLFEKDSSFQEISCSSFGYYIVVTEENIKQDMKYFSEYFSMWDDILISHDIHDSMIINFLSQHRKRKY
jgi:hypothetical protein